MDFIGFWYYGLDKLILLNGALYTEIYTCAPIVFILFIKNQFMT